MSTPMTAVAALPPPHYHHNHYQHHPSYPHPNSNSGSHQEPQQHQQSLSHHSQEPSSSTSQRYTHHQHQQQHHQPHLPHPSSSSYANHHNNNNNNNSSSYRPPSRIILPPVTSPLSPVGAPAKTTTPTTSNAAAAAARLLPPYTSSYASHSHHYHHHIHNSYSPASVESNTAHHTELPPRPPPHVRPYTHLSRHDPADYRHSYNSAVTNPAAEPAATTTMATTYDLEPSRKRRRSREPDWQDFYRNGLPKEIIVIDDSPEPTANTSRKIVHNNYPTAESNSYSTSQARKRRRPDEDVTDSQTVGYSTQHSVAGPSTSKPTHQHSTPIDSTFSSSDSTSALHTTAATSLSSSGGTVYEDPQGPLKRKRTRQQAANEAKRRDIDGFADTLLTYKPPALPPKKISEVKVRVIQDSLRTKHVKVDDDDGHYIVVPEADLTDRYQIVRLLGQGTFGKVVQARDRHRKKLVAIKIIRSVQKYRDASRIELRVLATLKANDEENRNRCIHLRDCFDYRGHICIATDLLDQSIFDFLKGNGFVPFPNSQIQNFARQLFTSVAFLHDLNLIHTDLKPENILLRHDDYQTFTYNRKIPSSSALNNRTASQRRVLLDTEICLIDFGSATFHDEYHSSVVSTRHYRAPEIILGLGWSYPCDIWSIGCILVEFFTGDALFQTHDNLEHLAMMEAVVGTRIDSHLVQAVNKMAARNKGNPASKYFKRLRLDYPTPETTRGSRRFVKAMRRLEDTIPPNNVFLKNFLDLLKKIFVYDPAQRITAKEALDHQWFKELAQPDDGTEAAKIRLQRKPKDTSSRQAQYVS